MYHTIVIAEDHPLTAKGMAQLLTNSLHARICETCQEGHEVLPALRTHNPDVLILDLSLPGTNGIELARQIMGERPDQGVVIYTGYDDDAYVTEVLRRGAKGYVLKSDDPKHLVDAVQAAADGKTHLSPSLPDSLVEESDPENRPDRRIDRLSPREKEVLGLVAEGDTSAQIAEKLHISKRTVDKHRENVKKKLEADSVSEMIRIGIQSGLLADPPAFDPSESGPEDD